MKLYTENFLDEVDCIHEAPEYEHFSNEPIFIILKQLYGKIKTYSSSVEKVVMNKDAVLIDPEWIEIQDLAKETLEKLNSFIKTNEVHDG